jgi:hypothetical protein
LEPSPLAKRFLSELRENPLFQEAMKEVKKFRPVVPRYKPGMNTEENSSLIERIKYESAREEGFDLIYLILTGERNG